MYVSDDIDECASNPCQNTGTCVNGVNRFWCVCDDGYTGLECQGTLASHNAFNLLDLGIIKYTRCKCKPMCIRKITKRFEIFYQRCVAKFFQCSTAFVPLNKNQYLFKSSTTLHNGIIFSAKSRATCFYFTTCLQIASMNASVIRASTTELASMTSTDLTARVMTDLTGLSVNVRTY